MNGDTLLVRHLGRQPYEPVWRAMQDFTDARGEETADEFWLLDHSPVYTLGRAGRREHVLAPGDVPVVQVDRGGQVTYHGPGQVVLYTLIDLRRRGLGVRGLVRTLEDAVIAVIAAHGVSAGLRDGAPGVYVDGRKIAALGLRVRRGCSFHGLALNVDCDLAPFAGIDPCGYRGLAVTRTRDEGIDRDAAALAGELVDHLAAQLGYAHVRAGATPELEQA